MAAKNANDILSDTESREGKREREKIEVHRPPQCKKGVKKQNKKDHAVIEVPRAPPQKC